jgi:hypothetical protein
MNQPHDLSFESLLEILAEKLVGKLTHEPSRLYPRLLTIEQTAVYLGRTCEDVQNLVRSSKLPTVLTHRRVFIDRLDLDRWIDDNKTGWV